MRIDSLSDIPRENGILMPQSRGHWWRIIRKFGLSMKPPEVVSPTNPAPPGAGNGEA